MSHKPLSKLDTSNWSRENLAWAAGYLEGEGCFTLFTKALRSNNTKHINWTSPQIRINVTSTEKKDV
mgnify:CR=1 FL=1